MAEPPVKLAYDRDQGTLVEPAKPKPKRQRRSQQPAALSRQDIQRAILQLGQEDATLFTRWVMDWQSMRWEAYYRNRVMRDL